MSNPVRLNNYYVTVTKHGSHNQASHGKKGGGASAGGAGAGSEGSEQGGLSGEDMKELKGSENAYWAKETKSGREGVKEINGAAAKGDATTIRDVRSRFEGKALEAKNKGKVELESSMAGVVDYANDALMMLGED